MQNNIVDAEMLLAMPLPKTLYIVDGLLPQGLSVFCGSSKIGKSWLMLEIGLKAAVGEPLWGMATEKCDVLYLSLEDTAKRLQDRLYKVTDCAPTNLRFMLASQKIGSGLEQELQEILKNFPLTKLVIIDTFQKVRGANTALKDGMYAADYADVSALKQIADNYKIAVVLVHHRRKLGDTNDPFNEISGSTGISGAADTNFILQRKRGEKNATLLVSGRDVEYQELTLKFDDLIWEMVERKGSNELEAERIPDFIFKLCDFLADKTEWVGIASELLQQMDDSETSPLVVTKYLARFSCDVLLPLGIEYSTKRTSQKRLIKFVRSDVSAANPIPELPS